MYLSRARHGSQIEFSLKHLQTLLVVDWKEGAQYHGYAWKGMLHENSNIMERVHEIYLNGMVIKNQNYKCFFFFVSGVLWC